jgi:MHS family proline/betaine transporter-like MFS transporter
MALSTFAIGLLPTYAHIGALAPLVLILLRMIQGASVGGEYTTSIIFLVEQSAPQQRGFTGSWASFSATFGILLGSLVGALVTRLFDPADVLAWGWRLPFLPGILLGAVAYVMRRQLLEESFTHVRFQRPPVIEAFQTSWRDIVRGFVIILVMAVSFYLIFVYLATYLQQVDSISATRALSINTISMIFLLIITPFAGILADRLGRKTVLALGAGGFVVVLAAVPVAGPSCDAHDPAWPVRVRSAACELFGRATCRHGGNVSAPHPLHRTVLHLQRLDGTCRWHGTDGRGLPHGDDA